MNMNKLSISLALAGAFLAACSAGHGLPQSESAHGASRVAEQETPSAVMAPVEVSKQEVQPGLTQLTLVAPESGHAHEIDIFVPAFAAPEGGYPVVLLLDGNRVSQFLREVIQRGTQLDAVYVTVGYQGTQEFAVQERALDFTPSVTGERTQDPLDASRVNGGAAAFLRFIEATLKPQVAQHVSVDWQQSTLWGHSYGGLFVLFTLLEQPSAFARYIAVDPSLWWQDAHLYHRLMQHTPRAPLDLTLLEANAKLVHGAHGKDPARVALRERLHAALPSGAAEQVCKHLAAVHRYYPEHHHGSIFAQSLNELLR